MWSDVSLMHVFVGITVLFVWFLYYTRARQVPGLPGSRDKRILPWLGGLVDQQKNAHRIHEYFFSLQKEFGLGVTSSGFGSPFNAPFVRVSSPENIKHVLKTNFSNYVKGPQFRNQFRDILGDGIFNNDGADWKQLRKIASHMFAMKVMQTDMARVFSEHCQEAVATLDKAAKTRSIIDLQDIFLRFTMDSIMELGFGIKINTVALAPHFSEEPCKGDENSTRLRPQTCVGIDADLAERSANAYAFTQAFDKAQAGVTRRFLDLLWPIKRIFGLGRERAIAHNIAIINQFAGHIIQERRGTIQQEIDDAEARGQSVSVGMSSLSSDAPLSSDQEKLRDDASAVLNKHPDLLSRFIIAGHEMNTPMTDKYLRDVVINFMLAGRDTTAVLLTWFCYRMMLHPEVVERCLQEIQEVVGVHNELSFEHVRHLHYVEATLLEVLRLHPSVPLDYKCALKDDVLPDGSRVPAGCNVGYSPYIIGRTPMSVWTDRTMEFVPERFLGPDGTVTCPDAFHFIAFNAGPRTCLGRRMALTEAKMMAFHLLTRYRFTAFKHPDYTDEIQLSVVALRKHGLMVGVERR